MNIKLRKNRGFTLALLILAACLIFSLVPTMSVSAKARNGKYYLYGISYFTGKQHNGKLKIKSHKLITTCEGVYEKNKKSKGKQLKKKKRTFTISKKCKFSAWGYDGKSYKRLSYKAFVKQSKQWVKTKGKNRVTGNYNYIYYTVKKGKVVKARMEWLPLGSE